MSKKEEAWFSLLNRTQLWLVTSHTISGSVLFSAVERVGTENNK